MKYHLKGLAATIKKFPLGINYENAINFLYLTLIDDKENLIQLLHKKNMVSMPCGFYPFVFNRYKKCGKKSH